MTPRKQIALFEKQIALLGKEIVILKSDLIAIIHKSNSEIVERLTKLENKESAKPKRKSSKS